MHANPLAEPRGSQQYGNPPSPSSAASTSNGTASRNASLDTSALLAKLPKKHEIPSGCVAVNDSNYRLDPYLPPISPDAMSRLKARVDKRRVCNSFHLQRFCEAGDRCEYDHEPLEEDLLLALEALARSQPCPRRGACRLEGCNHGHICQNPDCKHRGGKAYCKLPYLAHLEQLSATRYPPSASKQRKTPNGGTNGGSGSSTTSG